MPDNEPEAPKRFVTVTYLSDGQLDVQMNGMTSFDLWAMSNYLKMLADEQYINVRTQTKMAESLRKSNQLVTSTQMPRKAGKPQPLHRDDA